MDPPPAPQHSRRQPAQQGRRPTNPLQQKVGSTQQACQRRERRESVCNKRCMRVPSIPSATPTTALQDYAQRGAQHTQLHARRCGLAIALVLLATLAKPRLYPMLSRTCSDGHHRLQQQHTGAPDQLCRQSRLASSMSQPSPQPIHSSHSLLHHPCCLAHLHTHSEANSVQAAISFKLVLMDEVRAYTQFRSSMWMWRRVGHCSTAQRTHQLAATPSQLPPPASYSQLPSY